MKIWESPTLESRSWLCWSTWKGASMFVHFLIHPTADTCHTSLVCGQTTCRWVVWTQKSLMLPSECRRWWKPMLRPGRSELNRKQTSPTSPIGVREHATYADFAIILLFGNFAIFQWLSIFKKFPFLFLTFCKLTLNCNWKWIESVIASHCIVTRLWIPKRNCLLFNHNCITS